MTSSLAAAAAHAVPACADRQLAVGLGRADHGAGNVRLPVALTNTSAATCSVSGYLRVGLVGAHNRHLATHVNRIRQRHSIVVLRHGRSACALLGWVENQPRALSPRAIAIAAPSGHAAFVIAWQAEWGVVSGGIVDVPPLAAGTNCGT